MATERIMILLAAIPWAMVSALSASVGVIVALIFNMRNLANTRLSNSAKMVLDLVSTFNSEEMKRNRALFAKRLLEAPDSIDVAKNTPVLEFFEEVGYMTRRGVLDEGMVWNSFSWWFEPYYLAVRGSHDLIAEARSRTKAPSLFREIEWLNGRMQEISMREDKRSPPANDVHEMLTEEVKLSGSGVSRDSAGQPRAGDFPG